MSFSFNFSDNQRNTPVVNRTVTLKYPCNDKETCSPYEASFPKGKYRFSVYGAGGGTYKEGYDSPGGFSTGVLLLSETTKLYFYIGAKGVCESTSQKATPNSFGGGGRGYNGVSGSSACSGGGASDVRIKKDNLKTRIIVAGGAGGTGYNYWDKKNMKGGKGGGESGTKGEDSSSGVNVGGGPGNETSGGSSPFNDDGSFGFGGNRSQNNGCGGGGGWFGGGAGGIGVSAGGGGSGFVFLNADPNVELDKKYQLLSGRTEEGTNKDDGKIIIEIISSSGFGIGQTCRRKMPFLFSISFSSFNAVCLFLIY